MKKDICRRCPEYKDCVGSLVKGDVCVTCENYETSNCKHCKKGDDCWYVPVKQD